MNPELTKAVYDERSRIYHILTAVREAALAEPNISSSFLQYISDIQQEAEWNYMLVPANPKIACCFVKGEQELFRSIDCWYLTHIKSPLPVLFIPSKWLSFSCISCETSI